MATASKIQIEKVTELIKSMYENGQVDFNGYRFEGSFDCEVSEGFSAAMDWTCDEDHAYVSWIEAYDEVNNEDVDFDADAMKAIAEVIQNLSFETIVDVNYERELEKTVCGLYD